MDKIKRKGQGIHRSYWMIFSVLLLVLILMLPYPLRVLGFAWLNPVLYVAIGLICLLAGFRIARHYGWRHKILSIVLACVLLSGWIAYLSPTEAQFEPAFCSQENYGIGVYYQCVYIGNCPTLELGYIGIRVVPIVLKVHDYYDNPCGYPRPKSWR